jgi:hypothetical protein
VVVANFAHLFQFALVFRRGAYRDAAAAPGLGRMEKAPPKAAVQASNILRGVTMLIPAYNEAENIRSTVKSVIKE